jgi:hypothetical protein
MDNSLKVKDIKAISRSRYADGFYKRHPFVTATLIFAGVIALIGLIFMFIDETHHKEIYKDIIYKDLAGNQIIVNFHNDTLQFDNVVYTNVDNENDSQGLEVVSKVGLGLVLSALLVAFVASLISSHKSDKFKDKFVQNYIDKKEFLDVD